MAKNTKDKSSKHLSFEDKEKKKKCVKNLNSALEEENESLLKGGNSGSFTKEKTKSKEKNKGVPVQVPVPPLSGDSQGGKKFTLGKSPQKSEKLKTKNKNETSSESDSDSFDPTPPKFKTSKGPKKSESTTKNSSKLSKSMPSLPQVIKTKYFNLSTITTNRKTSAPTVIAYQGTEGKVPTDEFAEILSNPDPKKINTKPITSIKKYTVIIF